ncbi:deoxycytidyl transferase KNAG_0E00410 [Huiozyma naganishii CBS 8797]|uniref:DNA repair protein REV1 n=1 Tax=Huiozyma naganishii (strain ATCC MYA-139 / BCRC 22969 / CBS 8797 / KCTC 17520 / NBRC 10181 / NCYC 3082 / Yp74L-3) TaxID=1071383 RepID=J7S6C2_HUIN7|nr:hypothetical protein KNAG_0E00410 [Kazachstania naganishii CBS 8797]CCK70309.1 hypothetical protein KNAG_0E00410 [Kazachstania naganishii CBS 8797]
MRARMAGGDAGYSYGEYFADKREKQRRQDEAARGFASRGGIFAGLVVYVNGYTRPWDRLKLHAEIVKHGGEFCHYMSGKRQVTHIIASNLTLKKFVEFRNYKVVSAQWVVDSIQRGRLLPWQDYRVEGQGDDQQKLDLKALRATSTTDCNGPDFITNYFSNSRLHLLSSWKAKLYREALIRFQKGAVHLPQGNDTLTVFHIDFDSFFAITAYLYRPIEYRDCEFDKDPIVVCHGKHNSDIASCNYVARGYGVKNGMWVREAEKLMPGGVHLVKLPYCFKQFRDTSDLFYKILIEEFKDEFGGLVYPISIDELLAVIVNCKLDTAQLCERIRQRVFEQTQGCSVSIGVAGTRIGARLALKLAKPNGYKLWPSPQEDDTAFLDKLVPSDIPGLGPSLLSRLHASYPQVKTLLQLRGLTLKQLQTPLGEKVGEKTFYRLRGQDDPESLKLLYEPETVLQRKTISVDINWAIRFRTIEQVDTFMDRCATFILEDNPEVLTAQVTLKIMQRCADAPLEPTKYLGMGRCNALSQSSNLGLPTRDPGVIITELHSLFRKVNCLPGDVRGVGVSLSKLTSVGRTVGHAVGPLRNQPTLPFLQSTRTPNSTTTTTPVENSRKRCVSPLKTLRINEENDSRSQATTEYQEQFLSELPTQIRREINREQAIKRKVESTKLDKIRADAQKRQKAQDTCKDHFLGQDSLFEPIKFQGCSRFKDICKLINKWIDQTACESKGPHPRDVKLFRRYLVKLAASNRTHLLLQIANLISLNLNLKASDSDKEVVDATRSGLQEWDNILLHTVVKILNENKTTFQRERKVKIEFDI